MPSAFFGRKRVQSEGGRLKPRALPETYSTCVVLRNLLLIYEAQLSFMSCESLWFSAINPR